jgi:hypothetical protein
MQMHLNYLIDYQGALQAGPTVPISSSHASIAVTGMQCLPGVLVASSSIAASSRPHIAILLPFQQVKAVCCTSTVVAPSATVAGCRDFAATSNTVENSAAKTTRTLSTYTFSSFADAPPATGSSDISLKISGDGKTVSVDVKAGKAAAKASYAANSIKK